MPADASIYSLIQQPKIASPIESMGGALQLKALVDQQGLQALQRQQLEQGIAENQRVRDLFSTGRAAPTEAEAIAASPRFGLTYQKSLLDNKAKQSEIDKNNVAKIKDTVDLYRNALGPVNDQNAYTAWRANFVKELPQFAATVPEQFSVDAKRDLLLKGDELAKHLTPRYEKVDLGGRVQVVDVNPYTNPAIKGTQFDKTETPGQTEANNLSRARLGVQAATADPFGTLGIRSIAERAGALPAGSAPVAGATPQPSAQVPQVTGEQYLATLPKPVADQVKALAEGRMQFPGGFALKSPYWQQMIQAVSQYDPNFDAVNYNARAGVRKDFTSGNSAKSLNALNTVMGHLDEFEKAATALNNTDYPMFNKVANAVGGAVSPDLKGRLNAFNVTKQAVVSEMERAYRGTGGSQADIESWKQTLNDADSPEAIRAAIKQGVKLLGSKIAALGDTYSKGMGTTKEGIELLSPHAQATYNRLIGEGGQADGNVQTQAQPTRAQIEAELRRRGVIK